MKTNHGIFQDSHLTEQFNALKCAHHTESRKLLRRESGYIFSAVVDLTGCRIINTRYNVKQSSFACPIWTNNAGNLTSCYRQRNVLQGREAAEYFCNAFNLKQLRIPLIPSRGREPGLYLCKQGFRQKRYASYETARHKHGHYYQNNTVNDYIIILKRPE